MVGSYGVFPLKHVFLRIPNNDTTLRCYGAYDRTGSAHNEVTLISFGKDHLKAAGVENSTENDINKGQKGKQGIQSLRLVPF